MKNKSLYFLYEYICYNLYDEYNCYKLILLGIYNLQYYDNVIYLNDFHMDDSTTKVSLMAYTGILNIENEKMKQEDNLPSFNEYYIYTDKEISKCNIDDVFIINKIINIIHIHKIIYINDKLFLDYINIPRYILIDYPDNEVYNNYEKFCS